jgi:Zn-dependent protease/regulator of sirC expression with transglutaminase-like and TPR domain
MFGQSGIRLFNFFGIPVYISLFSIIITALIVLPVADRYGAVVATGCVVGLLISILLHELAHAFVGMRTGAKVTGVQLDMLGGATFFQHKSPSYFKDVLISAAGPATNFAIWGLCLWITNMMNESRGEVSFELFAILTIVGFYNLFLGILNALPGYPLDGGQIIHSFTMGVTRNEKFAALLTLITSLAVAGFLLFYFVISGARTSVSFGWIFWLFIILWIVSSAFTLYQQATPRVTFAPTVRQQAESRQAEEAQRAKTHKGFAAFEQGRNHMLAREYPQAITAFSEALRLEPDELSYLDYRAYTFNEMGEYQAALQDYNRLLQFAPNRDDYYSSRAQIFQKLGNYQAAAADADYALSINSLNNQAIEIKRNLQRAPGF